VLPQYQTAEPLARANAQARLKPSGGFAFFLLLIFTVFVLIRPQELFPVLEGIRPIAVLSVLLPVLILLTVRPIVWLPQHILLLLLVPFIMLSGTLNGWMGGGVFRGLDYLTTAFIPMFIFSMLLTTPGRQKAIMTIFIIASLLMVHNGHSQQTSLDGFGWAGIDSVGNGRIRYLGILGDPNDLGMLFMVTLPFVVYFYTESGSFGKSVMLLIASSLLYGIYMTNSRGTMIGLLGLLGLFALLRYGGRRAIIAGLLSIPVLLVVASSFRAISADEASAKGRLWAWWDGLEMLRANPVFGVGSGNFIEHHNRVAHNTYIQVVAELGLGGYVMWITTLFLTLFMGFYCVLALKTADNDNLSARLKAELKLSACCFYSLAASCMTAFFLSRDRFIVFYILIGIAIAAYVRVMSANKGDSLFDLKRVIPKIGAGAMLVIIATYLLLKATL
jgi:O-antigen ligase